MKKITVVAGALIAALVVSTFSCESLGDLSSAAKKPSLSMKNVSIGGLDLEGITFNANYSITNPYGVSLSLKEVAADIMYEDGKFTSIKTNEGINLAANATKTNSFSFKVPYDTILNYAKSVAGKKTLPFSVEGKAAVDVSSVPLLSAVSDTLSLPFTKAFEVPVFKPSLSVSGVTVKMPTMNEVKDALIASGMNVIKAAASAASLISGNGVSANMLDGVDLDIDLLFDLNVANEGSADWNFAVNNCSLSTVGGEIADVAPVSSSTISSKSGTIPMKASLNTIQTGAFIVQLLNKKGTNPVFNLKSGLTFPDTKYASNLPLDYSYEIPLSSVGNK